MATRFHLLIWIRLRKLLAVVNKLDERSDPRVAPLGPEYNRRLSISSVAGIHRRSRHYISHSLAHVANNISPWRENWARPTDMCSLEKASQPRTNHNRTPGSDGRRGLPVSRGISPTVFFGRGQVNTQRYFRFVLITLVEHTHIKYMQNTYARLQYESDVEKYAYI